MIWKSRLWACGWAALTLAACDADNKAAGVNKEVDAGARPDADAGAPSSTFPASGDPWAMGPFSPVTVENTGPDGTYTVFRPEELAPGGARNPIIVWGNGGGTTPSFYTTLPHLASHGFVVVAPNSILVTGPMLRAGLDWIFAQNDDASSDLHQKLDTSMVGAMGYSFGSLAVYDIIDDPRLVTTVHASGGLMSDPRDAVLKEPGPTAYFCDGMDTKANCDGDYAAAQVPVFYGTLLDAVHIAVFLPPFVDRVNGAAAAWFRWQLMGDKEQRSVFLGDSCTLCTDPNWTVQRKNWD